MCRKLICGIGCFMFVAMVGLPASAPACHHGTSSHHSKQSLESAFYKMDVNHDGVLTQDEYVAAHQKKGTTQAAAHYKKLAARGGTTTRNGVTGMTLRQYKAAHTSRS